jgi:hypothetical protein
MVTQLSLKEGQVLTKNQVMAWFHERYAKIKVGTVSAHRTRRIAPPHVYG